MEEKYFFRSFPRENNRIFSKVVEYNKDLRLCRPKEWRARTHIKNTFGLTPESHKSKGQPVRSSWKSISHKSLRVCWVGDIHKGRRVRWGLRTMRKGQEAGWVGGDGAKDVTRAPTEGTTSSPPPPPPPTPGKWSPRIPRKTSYD